jgi:hypothetical protein
MNRNETTAAVSSMILAVSALAASAQSPVPDAPAGASASAPPQVEQKVPARARSDAPTDADARHCLEFATNLEVIACAEKYRPHKGKG